jgi:hypothetical protein
MRPIRFSSSPAGCDRRHWLSEDDIRVVLSRLPPDAYERLRAVHFNDRSRGARMLGYVNMGHREIAICALPPRMSLTRFLVRGHSPGSACQNPPTHASAFGLRRRRSQRLEFLVRLRHLSTRLG